MKQLISLMMALCLICASLPLSLAERNSPRMITTTFQAAMSPRLSSRAMRKAEMRQAIRTLRHARKED